MDTISQSELMAILEACRYFSPDMMEKIKRLTAATPSSQVLDKLIDCSIISEDTAKMLSDFLGSLAQDAARKSQEETKSKTSQTSIYSLAVDKKKEILFARQLITQGLCTLDDINKCFAEQASFEKKLKKTFPFGQMMVKNNLVPAKKFAEICREIEEKIKNTAIDTLLADDKNLRALMKNDLVQFAMGSIPEKFGPYRILAEIARGGMGVVYKAWDAKLRRSVALKVLKAWENPSLEDIQRFDREARLAARLKHSNIVNIYDAGVVESVHYFTMDYVEGETLSQHLTHEKPTPTESLIVIKAMAEALAYAHGQKVIHRDVKPGNIMLDASNKPLLTDFGLAKGLSTSESHHLTKSGAALGTPAYMSPEQARGDTEIDARSDIYSLGAVLYEMLTGRPPFEGDAVGLVISAVLSQEPIPPSKLKPNVDASIEAICFKAMAKNPQQRYQTAQEMAEDIARCLSHETVKAKPVTSLRRLGTRIAKHAFVFIFVGALCAIIALVSMWFGLVWLKEYNKAQQDYEAGKSLLAQQNYAAALPLLNEAARHRRFYGQVRDKLQQAAETCLSKGNTLLDNYGDTRNELERFYEKAWQRLQDMQDWDSKAESFSELEKLEEIRRKNESNLSLALQNFCYALTCQPSRQETYDAIGKIYRYKLSAQERPGWSGEKEWYWKSWQFYRHCAGGSKPSKDMIPSGTLWIQSSTEKARVYLFAYAEHYQRLIPVAWRQMEYPDMQQPASDNLKYYPSKLAEQKYTRYLKTSEPLLDKESYLGETPLKSDSLQAGQYLLVIEAPNCMQIRQMVEVLPDKEVTVDISLVAANPLLQQYAHAILPGNQDGWHYFFARQEVSAKEYGKFLNDPTILYRYRNARERNELRYVPRLGDTMLWRYQQERFVCLGDEETAVIGVSWQDATEYCQWLSNQARNRIVYRLPYFREWEAATGKQDKRLYTWGNLFDNGFLATPSGKSVARPNKVSDAAFDLSPHGIYDMAGNVREWCLDSGSENTQQAIVAGGSFLSKQAICFQIGYHAIYTKETTAADVGFRVMASMPKN
jgi:tRNA A-37 threonylcarbamoyl transferase component Bud32